MQFPLMIFAAGFGTRMKHLTENMPKPMVPVAGKPLIDHAIYLAREAQAKPIVANLHYKADILDLHLSGSCVQTIIEHPHILDTGGGLRNALPILGHGPVMTLNSDAIWKGGNPLQQLAAAWQPEEMDALLMTIPLARTRGYTGKGNFIKRVDGTAARGPDVVYCGAQIMKTDLLHDVDEGCFSLNLIWDKMIAQNRLYTTEYDGYWCDVGHPDGITEAEKLLGYDAV